MTEQQPQLSLNDFALVVNIIDVCTERGAFKGNELSPIGQLREKFVAFIKANTPEEAEVAEETAEEAR
jgi:hypothetical protein